MAIRGSILLFAVLLCCFCCYGKVEGGNRKLSRKEDLEIEKQLKLLNKPALKTIKTESGDIYDCVDFYKQPAFDHPLLKNHTYHYETTPISPNKKITDKEPAGAGEPLKIGLQGEGCPIGTVPIRRTTKEDLIRAKLFADTYASRFNPLTVQRPGLHRAIVRTRSVPAKKYNGGGGMVSVYQPSVSDSQFSSAQMTIQGGSDNIQVGWTVNPSLYGDTKTRLFTFFKAGPTFCFNTQCPGFVIVNTDIPLDSIITTISTRGGPIYDMRLFVYRDQVSGNWWLEVGPNYSKVGYWPSKIFSGLKDLATYVDWGGEAYSPLGQHGPEMGAGDYLDGDTNKDAFCKLVTTVNEAHNPEDAQNTETFSDDIRYYQVDDWGVRGQSGHVMTFGGPGPQ
ncbi:hypothetical protein L484_022351 [Morus notabilis]|uniref:Neprosin PEP catalytic domain-containing protein n=1 Tax=Morus notabilis TaxID=981085 RepID=W9R5E4_9ROSA|nr:hypothetical protein L484_022351 [Morus notabilis]